MFRLDYISCVLTIGSTILVGRKRWEGWMVAGVNSVVICDIAKDTSQLGFIPANLFCLALYTYNIWEWRKGIRAREMLSQRLTAQSLGYRRQGQVLPYVVKSAQILAIGPVKMSERRQHGVAYYEARTYLRPAHGIQQTAAL